MSSIVKSLFFVPLSLLLVQCSGTGRSPQQALATPSVRGGGGMQQIINVSSYDPKERQREGRSYSENDVSALRANGA